METTDATPYAGLTPDVVLNAIESTGLKCDGRIFALNSYENRVYQIWLEDDSMIVAKFYRPQRWSDAQILEEHAFVAELAEREIPVVAPLEMSPGKTLSTFENFRFAIYPKQGGRAPELEQANTLEWVGRFLGRIHAVGAIENFHERPALNIDTFGEEPRQYLIAGHFLPRDLKDAWSSVVDQALIGVRRCFDRAGDVKQIRLHGDCHNGNILWTDAGPHFVDFDDSRMGPAIQDLWMLLSGETADMTRQFADVLFGYEDFFEFDRRELHLIEALRTLRLIHYSAWIARRWDDPAFPAAFPWFNTQRYWQDRILELREQISLMEESALTKNRF
jgi:Ser/Thr protein kinase RdoA (MazF antagonist)